MYSVVTGMISFLGVSVLVSDIAACLLIQCHIVYIIYTIILNVAVRSEMLSYICRSFYS